MILPSLKIYMWESRVEEERRWDRVRAEVERMWSGGGIEVER